VRPVVCRLANINESSNDSIAEWTREETNDASVSMGVYWKIPRSKYAHSRGLEDGLGKATFYRKLVFPSEVKVFVTTSVEHPP
jgi:hypothetical protein